MDFLGYLTWLDIVVAINPNCFFMTILFYSCQFEDIGSHGTKIIIYNLWLNDEGIYELSFDDDDEVHCILKMTFHLFAFQYLVSVIPP